MTVKVNTVDHNTFQENINNYLQGTPGRRVHLVRRLPDAVLRRAGPGRRHQRRLGASSAATTATRFKKASTGDDGKQYFVPIDNYPWAVFYRKSVFAEKGYTVPKTLDELDDARRRR